MSKAFVGEAMAVFCALLIRGISIPLLKLLTSSIELALAVAPVMFTLKDWEVAVRCKVVATVMASTKRTSLVILKSVKIKN